MARISGFCDLGHVIIDATGRQHDPLETRVAAISELELGVAG